MFENIPQEGRAPSSKLLRWLSPASEYVLGGILVFSGCAKILSPGTTLSATQTYLPLKSTLLLAGALFIVSVIEIVLGVLLISRTNNYRKNRYSIAVLLLFSIFFTVSLARALSHTGTGCGCFGMFSSSDSIAVSLTRDTLLLLLALSVAATRLGTARLLSSVPIILVAFATTSALFSIVNRHLELQSVIGSPQSSKWYGYYRSSILGRNAESLAKEMFPNMLTMEAQDAMSLAHRIVGTTNGDIGTIGYVTILAAPVPCKNCGYFELAVVLDSYARPLSIRLNPPKVRTYPAWPSIEATDRFIETLLSLAEPRFLSYGKDVPLLESAPPVGKAIIAVLNNVEYNVLLESVPRGEF